MASCSQSSQLLLHSTEQETLSQTSERQGQLTPKVVSDLHMHIMVCVCVPAVTCKYMCVYTHMSYIYTKIENNSELGALKELERAAL